MEELIYFEAALIGLAKRMRCRMQATRTKVDETWVFSDYRIIEDTETEKLPDGDYDVQIEKKQIAFKRKNGKFSARL